MLATPGDPLSSIAPPRDAPSSPLGGTVAYRVKRDPTPVGSDPKDARHSVKQSSKHCPLHHQRLSLLPPVQRETVAGGPSRSSRSLPLNTAPTSPTTRRPPGPVRGGDRAAQPAGLHPPPAGPPTHPRPEPVHRPSDQTWGCTTQWTAPTSTGSLSLVAQALLTATATHLE